LPIPDFAAAALLTSTVMPRGQSLFEFLVGEGALNCSTWFEILSGGPAEVCSRLSLGRWSAQ
jgi:hypothetical protein